MRAGLLAKAEAVPVVTPWLSSAASEVRIAALRAMLTLDPSAAAPYLGGRHQGPRQGGAPARSAALGLSGKEAFELGTQAIRDGDPDVRSLAALVLGVSSAEVARPILMEAMRDKDSRVRARPASRFADARARRHFAGVARRRSKAARGAAPGQVPTCPPVAELVVAAPPKPRLRP